LSGLESALQAILSPLLSNPRISTAQRALANGVDRKCGALEAPLDSVFAGDCGDESANLSEFEVCVIAAARCAACSKINAFDDLDLDCDEIDDQLANRSCS